MINCFLYLWLCVYVVLKTRYLVKLWNAVAYFSWTTLCICHLICFNVTLYLYFECVFSWMCYLYTYFLLHCGIYTAANYCNSFSLLLYLLALRMPIDYYNDVGWFFCCLMIVIIAFTHTFASIGLSSLLCLLHYLYVSRAVFGLL